MKVFCDTNVLVGALLRGHPHHNAARQVVERVVTATPAPVAPTTAPTDALVIWPSVIGAQLSPPSVVFQRPPPVAPK